MAKIVLPIVKTLADRMSEAKPLIQVIRGPRQVGKTTCLEQFTQLKAYKGKTYLVSADGVVSSHWIAEQWQTASAQGKILIIDEIQKIPRWDEAVKKLWDESVRKKRAMKCIFTGSSSLTLQKGLTESLTGRFEDIPATHWNFEHSKLLVKKMTIETFLIMGGYPGSYEFLGDSQRWARYIGQSIVETVIGRDILLQVSVRSPALFRQCFQLLCSYPAQVVSYNKLLGQLQDRGNIDLIKHYIELFEAAFLIKTIPKFYRNEVKKKGSSPKIIVGAPALATYHRINHIDLELQGRILESYVGALLISSGHDVFYWAEGDYEIDFVIEVGRKIIAIEVKSGKKRRSNSFDVFQRKYSDAKLVFIDKNNLAELTKNPAGFFDHRV